VPPITILIVTHDLVLARELSDEVWLLEKGSLVERGTARELLVDDGSRLRSSRLA
jgi:ABC-type glutathione transport system ATPase component